MFAYCAYILQRNYTKRRHFFGYCDGTDITYDDCANYESQKHKTTKSCSSYFLE